ncbi:MAG TPA: SDR family oxidoreductase [Acidimicrobiales bacterium]|nr:SDR family oxidoreductase [Acidimicrobiales bacterium]
MTTALITGASRGLGFALARSLAGDGWHLVLTARHADALDDATRELGDGVVAIAGDVTDARHRAELVDAAREVGGGAFDVLVNNASGLGPDDRPIRPLADYPLDDLDALFRTNVSAPLGLIQLALPALRGTGRIVNVTSDAAVEGYEGWGGYGATKAALDQLTNVLAAEHPTLHVYAVDPGDLRTQMHQDAFPGEDISDRPLPEAVVPNLRRLIDGDPPLPSGRYRASEL